MSGHGHHADDTGHHPAPGGRAAAPGSNARLALSATAHCLVGCAAGELVGMLIGMALGLSAVRTLVLAVALGFAFGFALGVLPLLRAGFSFGRALRQVLVAETLSIAVMEGVEVAVAFGVPGAMEAHVTAPLFWGSMALGLAAGFVAAYPVNYLFVSRGIRHHH